MFETVDIPMEQGRRIALNSSGAPDSLVSIIMPAFNAQRTLAEAVASVLAQTFSHWELLIMDDASRDLTNKIAQDLALKDPRIHCYRNEHNLGVAKTRNKGIALASGEWVAFLDSDDCWRPDKLDKQIALAAETGADLLYTSYSLWVEASGSRSPYIVPKETNYSAMLEENVIGCSTAMVRRDVLCAHPFSTELYHEDYALWLELLRSGCRAAGCSEILVDWRVVPDSRSFRKWNAAKHRWAIYRRSENLSLIRSLAAFGAYGIRGLRKHKRV